jgi:hypothetical protein
MRTPCRRPSAITRRTTAYCAEQGHDDRRDRGAPVASAGAVLVRHRRQLRLQLLLLPLPRRRHRCQGEADSIILPEATPLGRGGRTPTRSPPTSPARTTSTCSASVWTGVWMARSTWSIQVGAAGGEGVAVRVVGPDGYQDCADLVRESVAPAWRHRSAPAVGSWSTTPATTRAANRSSTA